MVELFHFSDSSDIVVFEPRPVRIASQRRAGQEWLNGPLVWAIDRPHSMLYLFPRDCPRVVIWSGATTTPADRAQWLGAARAVAWIEEDWIERVKAARLFRYVMPVDPFESLDDAGMWVSREPVRPTGYELLKDLPRHLAAAGVELRSRPRLSDLSAVWTTTLHASGIRLRNAAV